MSIIFLNGLMTDRHDVFIRHLSTRYTLTGTRLAPLMDDPSMTIIDYMDDLGILDSPLAEGMKERLEEQTQVLAANLAADVCLSPVGPEPGWQLSEAEIQETIRPRVIDMMVQELRFRVFVQQHPVDLVISGSDYGSHARVIARVAREMGIPTLDLEHGFFFNHITPEYTRTYGKLPLFFTSEYVNLDNALETELFIKDLANFPDQGTKFLSMGTPISTVASDCLPRDEAVAALGRDGDKIQILLAGSWNEARSVQKLVRGQVEMIDAYEDLFRSLANRELGQRVQLTIKLHPADVRPDVLPGVKAGLEKMAERCGLPNLLVKSDMLPEVLGAADIVLAMGYSSVLYDAFLLGKPSVVVFPPFLVYSEKEGWETGGSLPQKAGVCIAATDGKDTWDKVEAWLEPQRQEKFRRDHTAFSEKYGLHYRAVDEKCAAIMAWIEEKIAE